MKTITRRSISAVLILAILCMSMAFLTYVSVKRPRQKTVSSRRTSRQASAPKNCRLSCSNGTHPRRSATGPPTVRSFRCPVQLMNGSTFSSPSI